MEVKACALLPLTRVRRLDKKLDRIIEPADQRQK